MDFIGGTESFAAKERGQSGLGRVEFLGKLNNTTDLISGKFFNSAFYF